jgi:hypothetical protein
VDRALLVRARAPSPLMVLWGNKLLRPAQAAFHSQS